MGLTSMLKSRACVEGVLESWIGSLHYPSGDAVTFGADQAVVESASHDE